LPLPDRSNSRLRTAAALAALSWARFVVATLPFSWWRDTLGGIFEQAADNEIARARRFSEHVEWAAKLLPFSTKCLPRAMALSWILRSKQIAHSVVFAVRPTERRDSDDRLHAWVEISGETILGDLPGPWVETLRLGDSRPCTD
jgi:hypothetical protein